MPKVKLSDGLDWGELKMSEFCGGNHKRGGKQNLLRLVGEKKEGGNKKN